MATKKTKSKPKAKSNDPIALLKEIDETRAKLKKLEAQVAGALDSSIKNITESMVMSFKIDWKGLQRLALLKGLKDGVYDEQDEYDNIGLSLYLRNNGSYELEGIETSETLAQGSIG